MANKIVELDSMFQQDDYAAWITHIWTKYNNQRAEKINEWKELRNFLFATDTTTTTNSTLPWKNSTTIPKLCQIRDNLHSNYISALFPNDDWLRWQAYTKDEAAIEKARTIESYIGNKTRESRFRAEISKLLYDYIDYGNAFATTSFVSEYKELADGTLAPIYVGPVVHRISPLDIVFNPMAENFESTFKIIRSVRGLGELKRLAETDPDQTYWLTAIERRMAIKQRLGGYSVEDFDKAIGYQADGFGSMYEYYNGDFIEILEFYGDYHNQETGDVETRRVITIVDRSCCVRNEEIPNWMGDAPIFHVGWRYRQDNLWSMGPLDNLVGMQYRIDHLENAKADALDLAIHPPLAIIGEVEEFEWGPGCELHMSENGSVTELGKNLNAVYTADLAIQSLMDQMELMAGAPREAMGMRTPGEKTATEFMELFNAASRIFQEKITHFELSLLEPVLNSMLEQAARNLDTADVIRVMSPSLGVEQFKTITRDDIVANGILRPVGARHFSKQAQDLQNIINIMNSPIGEMIRPHTSGEALTKFVNDVTSLKNYDVFMPNIAVQEGKRTEQLAGIAQDELVAEAGVPLPV